MILWKYCIVLSTSLLIVITDSKTTNHVRQIARSTDNDFSKMLHSIIKINEKRVNSLKTLINLDDYNKAKIALRNKLNIYDGTVKKPEIIGIIIGDVVNTDTSNKDKYLLKYNRNVLNRRHYNGVVNRHGKRNQLLGKYKVETIVKPLSKDSDTSSSEMDCYRNKNNCHGYGKCIAHCTSYCVDSCNNAFKNFCLTYACDYSMKAQMENECNDFCTED